jgi:hypothetical protein
MTARPEEQEWRKLCEMVANERDPKRLSQLIDQLIEKLDSRREQAFSAATRDQQLRGNSGS